MTADEITLGLDAFIRSVGINKGTQHGLLIGAGASISSGIPSAGSCIWEWKRAIFLTKNPGLEAQFRELSLPAVRDKIQKWLDGQRSFPTRDSGEEYGVYIQKCYPIAEDRRAFFQEKIRQASPHTGYRLLIKLAESGLIRSVWTPNFDGLVSKAAAASQTITPVEVGIDCSERLVRPPNRRELLCVSIHGDYRYDLLKNTALELQEQDKSLRESLIAHLQHEPLIVSGYSGRDDSLMMALEDAYSRPGTGTLYWCGFGDGDVPASVRQLIQKARAAGRSAYYIQAGGFDDLMIRLALHCLEGDSVEEARQLMMAQTVPATEERVEFWIPDLPAIALIKSNAFPFTPPGEIYEFDLKEWPEKGAVWEYIDACCKDRSVVAAPFRGKVYAFGTVDDIRVAFSERIGEKIERVPINDIDLRFEDGIINSLICRALVMSMAAGSDVNTDGREFLWAKTPYERRPHGREKFQIYRAIVVYLRHIAGKHYVVLKPTIHVETLTGGEAPEDVARDLKLEVLGYQHNNKFNQEIDGWRTTLLKEERLEFPVGCSSPFRFHVQRAPIVAEIRGNDRTRRIQIKDKFRKHLLHKGMEVPEPQLQFSNRTGSGVVQDPHPVRGIVENRPFDFPLTMQQHASAVQIGVLCPAAESGMLSRYLQQLHQLINPSRSEEEYLPTFPGFQTAFGIPLQIPSPGNGLWVTCPEVDSTLSDERGALQLYQHISSSLNALKAAAAPNVIIVFIPTRWAQWRRFETDKERFDLHNFVKAFCVPQGIATQFLEEDTLQNSLQCRIRWWLGLALYVKSMRTPWVLSSLDQESAFVGLGMSLDRKAEKGNHVILGCSHLYNSQGQGLQFRLSKIENPIIRRHNAFMSYDDARRVGETIRQLFWESRFKLPHRVVIHKLTPFLSEERRGLQAGLSGVNEIDLLEIQVDSALRYLSSIPQADGSFKEDGFPVKRGTLLKLDHSSALLWVHGVAKALNPRLKYYQGKRRIPAPLIIRRHAGRSDLSMIGEEILGLSKMNWNSFDLYTKLPATVESSRQIARIGALLQRFGASSYDYRLFM